MTRGSKRRQAEAQPTSDPLKESRVIKVSELEFEFPQGDFRLEVNELVVPDGGQVAVIGPSGTGKTTLLNLVAGILTPVRGTVSVNQVNVGDLSDSARRNFRVANVGLVFQEFELVEYLTVLDNILLPFRINSSLRLTDETTNRARALADRLEVADKLRRYPHQLSQGERQRVAICRALVVNAKTVLADEPTGNLDPVNKNRVVDLLLDYATEHKVTLLAVTHDHGLLDRFQRVIDFDEFINTKQRSPA
jgi:putative ABC transport system ATP-binding protein